MAVLRIGCILGLPITLTHQVEIDGFVGLLQSCGSIWHQSNPNLMGSDAFQTCIRIRVGKQTVDNLYVIRWRLPVGLGAAFASLTRTQPVHAGGRSSVGRNR